MKNKYTLYSFLRELDEKSIHYRLSRIRESILVEIAVPGERWEAEFFEDGRIEVERFVTTAEISDGNILGTLFEKFSD